jgi:hypothetical protein
VTSEFFVRTIYRSEFRYLHQNSPNTNLTRSVYWKAEHQILRFTKNNTTNKIFYFVLTKSAFFQYFSQSSWKRLQSVRDIFIYGSHSTYPAQYGQTRRHRVIKERCDKAGSMLAGLKSRQWYRISWQEFRIFLSSSRQGLYLKLDSRLPPSILFRIYYSSLFH